MDTAKAIGIIVNNPEFADVRSLEGVAPTTKPSVPIIAVPTTAGTAAEVTINYVIKDDEKQRKFVCVDTKDIPIIAMGVEGVENMSQEEYRKAAVDAVAQLARDVKIPENLKEIAKEEDLDFLVDSAFNDACAPGNPKDASKEDIRALYLSLM